jgi:hypothetical protein
MALKDYLDTRRTEIEADIKRLRAELADIKKAEAAVYGGPGDQPPARRTRRGTGVRVGSIKDWILRALRREPLGLETEDVIAAVQAIGGPVVPRNSMTPQLSRLKAAGLVTLDGRLWRIVQEEGSLDIFS